MMLLLNSHLRCPELKTRALCSRFKFESLRRQGGDDAVAKAERRSLGDDRPALSGCKAGEFTEHDCFPVAALAGNEHEPSRCSSTVFEPLREIVDNWLSADKQRGNFSCGGFERVLSQAGLASIFFS